MSTDAKAMLEEIGAEMRKELAGALVAPLGIPITFSTAHDFDFGLVCVRAIVRAGLQIRTQEGLMVVLTKEET